MEKTVFEFRIEILSSNLNSIDRSVTKGVRKDMHPSSGLSAYEILPSHGWPLTLGYLSKASDLDLFRHVFSRSDPKVVIRREMRWMFSSLHNSPIHVLSGHCPTVVRQPEG